MTTCGIVLLRGGIDPIGAAVGAGFVEAGCAVRPLVPAQAPDLTGLDLVLIYGPLPSLAPALPMLRRSNPCPPVVVWLTEQVPNPAGPHRWQAAAARWRFRLERLLVARQGSARFPAARSTLRTRAGRLRVLGELLALRELGCLTCIAAFTETNAAYLRRQGLPAMVVPMGYHPSYGQGLGLPRDLDVVFLGTLRDRRRAGIIRRLQHDLDGRGITLTIRDGSPSRGYAYGAERIALLNRAKIMLNLMRQPWDDAVHRMLLAAPNGALLVSEPIIETSWGPFRPGEHFVMAPLDRLADTLAEHVAGEAERSRIATRAEALVMGELTMARMAGRVLGG